MGRVEVRDVAEQPALLHRQHVPHDHPEPAARRVHRVRRLEVDDREVRVVLEHLLEVPELVHRVRQLLGAVLLRQPLRVEPTGPRVDLDHRLHQARDHPTVRQRDPPHHRARDLIPAVVVAAPLEVAREQVRGLRLTLQRDRVHRRAVRVPEVVLRIRQVLRRHQDRDPLPRRRVGHHGPRLLAPLESHLSERGADRHRRQVERRHVEVRHDLQTDLVQPLSELGHELVLVLHHPRPRAVRRRPR